MSQNSKRFLNRNSSRFKAEHVVFYLNYREYQYQFRLVQHNVIPKVLRSMTFGLMLRVFNKALTYAIEIH